MQFKSVRIVSRGHCKAMHAGKVLEAGLPTSVGPMIGLSAPQEERRVRQTLLCAQKCHNRRNKDCPVLSWRILAFAHYFSLP
jgi:hypothetical protein